MRQRETEPSGPVSASVRFWTTHAALPVALGLVVVLGLDLTGLDVRAASAFWDADRGEWTYRSSWWATGLVHEGGRRLVALLGVGALAAFAGSFLSDRMRPLRRAGACVFLSIGLTTGIVALMKHASARHCPRDMAPWGGSVPYTGLLDGAPADCPPGHCFPGGHSSGAWSLLSLHFAARALRARRAWAWLVPALVLGPTYSFAQLVRGSHFPSHDAASGVVAWIVCLGLALVLYPRGTLTAPSRPA